MKFIEVAVANPSEGAFLASVQFSHSFSFKVPKCKGLGILLLPDDHLLHHEVNLPGVECVVEDGVVVVRNFATLESVTEQPWWRR